MRVKAGTTLFVLTFAAAALTAQGTPPAAQGGRRAGGFVPGQQRPPGDPAQIARGKTLYGISCTGCHGADPTCCDPRLP
jgi:cytochrome c oxidase cbb3-type subunit 3